MDNEFVKSAKLVVNYQGILEALIAKTRESMQYRDALRLQPHIDVRDLRTVGFTVGRQSGKTDTIVDFMTRHPFGECMVICKDDKIYRSICASYSKKMGSATTLPTVTPRQIANWETIVDSNGAIQPHPEKYYVSENVKYLLVDDASFTLNGMHLNLSTFNKWVGKYCPKDLIVILIG
jgi:hypothetical protein